MIASKAGGRPFDDLMRDEVFRPLGLKHTPPERGVRVAGRARGYSRTDTGFALTEQKAIDVNVGEHDTPWTAPLVDRIAVEVSGGSAARR